MTRLSLKQFEAFTGFRPDDYESKPPAVINDGELTDAQVDRIDDLHGQIYELLIDLIEKNGHTITWDITEIAAVADVIETIAVKHGWTEQEFYPFVESQNIASGTPAGLQ